MMKTIANSTVINITIAITTVFTTSFPATFSSTNATKTTATLLPLPITTFSTVATSMSITIQSFCMMWWHIFLNYRHKKTNQSNISSCSEKRFLFEKLLWSAVNSCYKCIVWLTFQSQFSNVMHRLSINLISDFDYLPNEKKKFVYTLQFLLLLFCVLVGKVKQKTWFRLHCFFLSITNRVDYHSLHNEKKHQDQFHRRYVSGDDQD